MSKNFKESRRKKIDISGFFVYLTEANSLKKVYRYGFSESISSYIESAFLENNALKRQWDNESLLNVFSLGQEKRADASLKLIQEAAEYYIIEKLSIHLTDYFNDESYDKSELNELSRLDIPTILLRNRFLELFSASMENRAAFEPKKNTQNHDNVVMSMRSGVFYSKFDLVLPKGARVAKEDDRIVIETKNFKLSMRIKFEGEGYVTPRDFEKYYLGLESHSSYRNFKVTFESNVEFKLLASLKKTKWNYHAWLDSFFNEIENDMSGEQFFNKIDWEAAVTIIKCRNPSSHSAINLKNRYRFS